MPWPLESFRKGPDEVLDYAGDWSDWLGSDTIVTSTWTVPTGLAKDSDTATTTTTTVWLSGGTLGEQYDLENCVETSAGRTACRTIRIHVVAK